MITVVSEGRCLLMTTYQIFQFIIGYAIVQAFETDLCYWFALNMGNFQYLVQDLFFTTILASFMGLTHPRSHQLSKQRPLQRVMSIPLLTSILLQIIIVVVFQILSLLLLNMQPGYTRSQGSPELNIILAPENTVTYIIALAQFIILAIVFNKGRPHRQELYTNKLLVVALLAQSIWVICSLFVLPGPWNFQELAPYAVSPGLDGEKYTVTWSTRFRLLALVGINASVSITAEYLVGPITRLITRWRPQQKERTSLLLRPLPTA